MSKNSANFSLYTYLCHHCQTCAITESEEELEKGQRERMAGKCLHVQMSVSLEINSKKSVYPSAFFQSETGYTK